VATTVQARTGRVVAFKTEVITPAPPPLAGDASASAPITWPVPGVALVLGAPAASTGLTWADGLTAPGVSELFEIYDPGPRPAQVQLALALDQGTADAITVGVAPQTVTTVDAGSQVRIPKGDAHAVVLTSSGGVGVVAERVTMAAPPASRSGIADLMGAPGGATRWLLVAGGTDASQEEWVVAYNPSASPNRLSVDGVAGGRIAPVTGLSGLQAGPGRRLAIRVNDVAPALDAALEVQAASPVIVERDLYGVGVPAGSGGLDASLAVPLPA
jgi:hypothetical protein